MPRKPRIEIAGYHHIANRGVKQRVMKREKTRKMVFWRLEYGNHIK